MRKNHVTLVALACLFVLLCSLYWKGDVEATIQTLGVKMEFKAKDKKTPSPATALP